MACDILPVAMFFLTCSCCRLGYIWNILEYLEYILGPKSYFQTLEITPLWQRGSFSYLLLLLLVGIYWNIWNILEYIWGPKNYLWGGNFSYLLLLLLLLLLRPVKKSYRWSLKTNFFYLLLLLLLLLLVGIEDNALALHLPRLHQICWEEDNLLLVIIMSSSKSGSSQEDNLFRWSSC